MKPQSIFLSSVLTASVLAASNAPTASIDSGPIVGVAVSLPEATAQVNQFLGIPFAQSPPERFSPPAAPKSWKQPLDTTAWKPACIQQFNYPEAVRNFTLEVFNTGNPVESEDCLYLNVYAPSTPAPPGGHAVMYWIYGGSLQFGTAGQPGYNGSSFAAYEDVIVVSVNYRTNVFGFPDSPELPLTGRNLGYLDQRAGLAWVQRNIKAFGGDPKKVTIFGESAGAFSVDSLLTSYPAGSSPPFRAAILQSGQVSYGATTYNGPGPSAWYNLTAALNCSGPSNLTCVRAAPATTIKSIIEHAALSFPPTPDNVTLVSDPAARRRGGNIAKIPVLAGSDAQEGRAFEVGTTNLTAFIQSSFSYAPALWPIVEKAYAGYGPSAYDEASQIWTEFVMQCPTALLTNATAAVGIPAWRYYFNASFPNTQGFPGAGVYHSSEIPIVFRTWPDVNVTVQEDGLGTYMQSAWARFAKNPTNGPGWVGVGKAGGYYGAQGDEDLAVLGNVGDVETIGATVVRERVVDERCAIFAPVYAALEAAA